MNSPPESPPGFLPAGLKIRPKIRPKIRLSPLLVITLLLAGIAGYQFLALQQMRQQLGDVDSRITMVTADVNGRLDNLTTHQRALQERNAGVESSVGNINDRLYRIDRSTDQLQRQLGDIEEENRNELQGLQSLIGSGAQAIDFTQLTSFALPAVVSIHTDGGVGSGVIVDSRGYVVTNYHVIDDISRGAIITYDKRSYSFRLVDEDPDADIALLQIEGGSSFPALAFEEAGNIKAGMGVIGFGSPGGLDFTVTNGIVSAVNRITDGMAYIQTDVPINPGNSGGPLVDMSGKVVGINTFKSRGYEGIGFAIPAARAKSFVERVIAKDQQSKR